MGQNIKHKEYWKINTEEKGFSKKFYSEEEAVKEAKKIEGGMWEENTEFYHYEWVEPQKGYYNEESYSY